MNLKILETRNDVATALLDIIRPLKKYYSPGHAFLHIGNTGVNYGENISDMEGFARILWGLGPLWSHPQGLSAEIQREADEWADWYLKGIINGTDPCSEEYWGTLIDYDQKMVEMAAVVTALCLAPHILWDHLSDAQKQNVYNFLNQINNRQIHPNNWVYFRILVNMTFQYLGLPWSEVCMKQDKETIEHCYMGDGWYCDGNPGQVDYYVPFAMHFYGLIYSKFMEKLDTSYCTVLKERSGQFFHDFVYWFSNDGKEIPFGRSLTYRFAHAAFFSALGFCEVGGVEYGVIKNLVLRNIETWMKRPIFDSSGILSIGYGYPNLIMSEQYNGPGSPYWGLKVFLVLAIPDDAQFWHTKEKEYQYKEKKLLKHPNMLVTHALDGHVMAYTAGQHCKNHGHSREKYEKFVYSNQFGFSISRESGVLEGAFDCTLAASLAGDEHYRMRYGVSEFQVNPQSVIVSYQLMPGVQVHSVVIPMGAWHVRVHKINTLWDIDIVDGSFSIETEGQSPAIGDIMQNTYKKIQISKETGEAFAIFPWGVSGAVSLTGGEVDVIQCFPNTNILYPLTVLPMVKKRLNPGAHVEISCILGDRSEKALEWIRYIPYVKVSDGTIVVKHQDTCVTEYLPM